MSYDRAGLGWSETGPRPRDARSVARELHAALHNAGQPAPYILVGASLGGTYAAVFADTFRSETAGLVLVDSVHPDQMQRLPAQVRRTLRGMVLINRMLPVLARVGLTHLIDITPVLLAGLPSKLRRTLPHTYGRSRIGQTIGPPSMTRYRSGTTPWSRCASPYLGWAISR